MTRFSDLTLTSNTAKVTCGHRSFYPGRLGNQNVTVMISPESKVEEDPLLSPVPLCTFREEIPSSLLNPRVDGQSKSVATVQVFPTLVLQTLKDFSQTSLRMLEEHPKDWQRKTSLFLLQLVTALKQLQAKGIEDTSLDMILVFESISGPRLFMMPPPESDLNSQQQISLCHCAAAAAQMIMGHTRPLTAAVQGPVLAPAKVPSPHAFSILVNTLREERSSSLTKVSSSI